MKSLKPVTYFLAKKAAALFLTATTFVSNNASAQVKDSIMVQQIVKEANDNSQLTQLAHELLDKLGPRLVGTPQMKQANDWAVAKYKTWGINARNEQWGGRLKNYVNKD